MPHRAQVSKGDQESTFFNHVSNKYFEPSQLWSCFEVDISMMSLMSSIMTLARYKKDSCNSLEPVYVTESWAYPGGGDDSWQEEGGKGLFDSPRRSSDRSPPFSIQIDFDQYRRNREYTSKVIQKFERK